MVNFSEHLNARDRKSEKSLEFSGGVLGKAYRSEGDWRYGARRVWINSGALASSEVRYILLVLSIDQAGVAGLLCFLLVEAR